MSDLNNSTAATATSTATESKAKTVAGDMSARRVFTDTKDAAAYLMNLASTLSDFNTTTAVIHGVSPNDDGELEFDPELYGPGMAVMVSTLREKQVGTSAIKAIVVTPIPTLESLMEDETGRAYLQKIAEKDLAHIAVRVLRDVADVTTVADQMPTTRAAYLTSGRDGGAGIMETYNELFKAINATMSGKVPVWAKARLTKGEMKKALESKGYATEFYPQLENRGEGKDSLLVMALNMGITAAKNKGLDPTIFQRWLDTRTTKTIEVSDEDDFDLDSLNEAMLAEDAD